VRRMMSCAAITLVAAVTALAPVAAADPVASVTSATWQGYQLHLSLLAKSVPMGQDLTQSVAKVTVAGTTVDATVQYSKNSLPDETAAQSIMLVIDSSGSMTGDRQKATNRAVTQFLDSAPTNAQIGVVAFSKTARLLTAPTADRSKVLQAVDQLKSSGDTALYDAVTLAAHVLGDAKPCTLLVLTDGQDTTSKATLGGTEQLLSNSVCSASFIGLQTDKAAFKSLELLAAAGHGRAFTAADSAGIAGVFVQSLTTTNAAIDVIADFPANFPDRNRAISVDLSIDSIHVGLTARADPVGTIASGTVTSTVLFSLAATVFAAIFLLVWLLTEGTDRARRRRVDTLIAEYAMRRVEHPDAVHEDTVVETLEDLIRPILARTKHSVPMGLRLDGAGLNLSAEAWTLIRLGLALALSVFAGVASGSAVTALAVGFPAGFAGPQFWLSRRHAKRCKRFEEGLPDALMLMASSLRSGFSLDQAILAASDQAESEVSTELRRAVQEIRIGSPLEAALDRIADRTSSSDFRWVVTALRIQRKSGGNLAELLITVSHTVRQRAQMGREVAALTAEGRLSAYVLIGLPIVLFAFLMLTQPAYLEPLWQTPLGLMVSGGGIVMLLIGWVLMKRLIKVEV
jgi:tight adherence protein B